MYFYHLILNWVCTDLGAHLFVRLCVCRPAVLHPVQVEKNQPAFGWCEIKKIWTPLQRVKFRKTRRVRDSSCLSISTQSLWCPLYWQCSDESFQASNMMYRLLSHQICWPLQPALQKQPWHTLKVRQYEESSYPKCCWLITERSNKDSIKLKECLIVCKPKRGVSHSRLNCNGLHSKMQFFSLPQAHFVKCLIRVTSAWPWASAEHHNHIFSQYTLSCPTAADTSVPSKLVYPDGKSPDRKAEKGHDGNPLFVYVENNIFKFI